jgi:hypothetical protein
MTNRRDEVSPDALVLTCPDDFLFRRLLPCNVVEAVTSTMCLSTAARPACSRRAVDQHISPHLLASAPHIEAVAGIGVSLVLWAWWPVHSCGGFQLLEQ